MARYLRIFSPTELIPLIDTLQAALRKGSLPASVSLDEGTDAQWQQLLVTHENGTDVVQIERNTLADDEDLVSGEIEEFLEEIADEEPRSAAEWISGYLPGVKTIYALQLLRGTESPRGWEILAAITRSIQKQCRGIIQTDQEGFSDEEGYQILWQFSDRVKGPWWVAVLQDGNWVRYQMELGNRRHRAAFRRGEVPAGITPGLAPSDD